MCSRWLRVLFVLYFLVVSRGTKFGVSVQQVALRCSCVRVCICVFQLCVFAIRGN